MNEKRRIFINDDDEVSLNALAKMLMLSGYDVEATKSSKEAISKIKIFRPDVILLDLLMPLLGGLEICEMLNKDNQLQGIPIIIISALGGYADINKAYKLGVVSYFTKPYEFTQLLQAIEKAIALKTKNQDPSI